MYTLHINLCIESAPKAIKLTTVRASDHERKHMISKKIDSERLRSALKGEDILTNLLDPALKHTTSTLSYLILYILFFAGLLFVVFRLCLQNHDTRFALRNYLRKIRGKINEKK